MRRYLRKPENNEIKTHASDVLIIGSGVAGLTCALWLCKHFKVTLITKGDLGDGSSRYAQGGIAAATSFRDSTEKHLSDTLQAGNYTNKKDAVELLVKEGPEMIAELESMGLNFDIGKKGEDLALEGGHSVPRVHHVADNTGRVIQNVLVEQINRSPVDIFSGYFALDLVTSKNGKCSGVVAADELDNIHVFSAASVILASGGAGHVFAKTTNPELCTGDGIAMAYRAGALIADMEFVQFHPTSLKGVKGPKSLITESLRGEGAYLLDGNHNRFMVDKHPMAELAPRDAVVKGMAETIAESGSDIYLDARHLGKEHLASRFPTIYKNLKEFGYDVSKDLIPVEPAAHYLMGGVATDLSGRTSINGLYACGEAACSGVHGANRLASNSLLEGLVFASQIYNNIVKPADNVAKHDTAMEDFAGDYQDGDLPKKADAINTEELRLRFQKTMSDKAGLIRNRRSLEEAIDNIGNILKKVDGLKLRGKEDYELFNLAEIAGLICRSALIRKESRGAHIRPDFPYKDDRLSDKHVAAEFGEYKMMTWDGIEKAIGEPWS